MGVFEDQRHVSAGAPQSLPHDTVEAVDDDGKRFRFARSDFEEFYETSDARQMRRHLRIGWLLVDERASRDQGQSPCSIDTALRRRADCVLAAQDDPQPLPRLDVTTYVLGLAKRGVSGTPVK